MVVRSRMLCVPIVGSTIIRLPATVVTVELDMMGNIRVAISPAIPQSVMAMLAEGRCIRRRSFPIVRRSAT